MVAHTKTIALQGVETSLIDVQVHVANGLPAFTIVGLPDKGVAESRERVRAALQSIGMTIPPKRITVNLSPADLFKTGSHFDLAIALGLLIAIDMLDQDLLSNHLVMGELGLDGSVAPVSGVLPAAMRAHEDGLALICPQSQGAEARWAGNADILATPSLLALVNHLKDNQRLPEVIASKSVVAQGVDDLSDVRGQEVAKRALEIAAAGGHNLLMIGPPGAGKSMLAARLPSILPELTPQEALATSLVHSVAGSLPEDGLVTQRPFRQPHHSASLAAMVGGGPKAVPGEISLSHNGVLFLDELPEFNRSTLEALRQPLETGQVSVARVNAHVTYPAQFQLVAAMNPCRCGYVGNLERACSKAPRCAQDYQNRISGPIYDRIDLVIEVPEVSPVDLLGDAPAASENSASVQVRVQDARGRQQSRFGKEQNARTFTNGQMSSQQTQSAIDLTSDAEGMLIDAAKRLKLSARGFHRSLKVAQTIADLDSNNQVNRLHMAEALSYRRLNYLQA